MTKYLDPKEYEYDVISGVSIGAFNTAVLGGYPVGQEKAAIDELVKLWSTYLP